MEKRWKKRKSEQAKEKRRWERRRIENDKGKKEDRKEKKKGEIDQ